MQLYGSITRHFFFSSIRHISPADCMLRAFDHSFIRLFVYARILSFMYCGLVFDFWRCVTCIVEEGQMQISGTKPKLVTILELVLICDFSFEFLFFFFKKNFCWFWLFLLWVSVWLTLDCWYRCVVVWDKPDTRSLGEPEESLHYRVLWDWSLHGEIFLISIEIYHICVSHEVGLYCTLILDA